MYCARANFATEGCAQGKGYIYIILCKTAVLSMESTNRVEKAGKNGKKR